MKKTEYYTTGFVEMMFVLAVCAFEYYILMYIGLFATGAGLYFSYINSLPAEDTVTYLLMGNTFCLCFGYCALIKPYDKLLTILTADGVNFIMIFRVCLTVIVMRFYYGELDINMFTVVAAIGLFIVLSRFVRKCISLNKKKMLGGELIGAFKRC